MSKRVIVFMGGWSVERETVDRGDGRNRERLERHADTMTEL